MTTETSGAFVTDEDTRASEEENDTGESDQKPFGRSERWAAMFWLALGVVLVILVLAFVGINLELLVPGIVLIFYGCFVLWDPELASSTADWTSFVWIITGLLLLVGLQVVDLYWIYDVTGIMIGLFLLFVGILGLLNL